MVAWQDLPWKHIQRQVFRLQKRMYRATQHGQVRIARKLCFHHDDCIAIDHINGDRRHARA
jgi:hypothetical protein